MSVRYFLSAEASWRRRSEDAQAPSLRPGVRHKTTQDRAGDLASPREVAENRQSSPMRQRRSIDGIHCRLAASFRNNAKHYVCLTSKMSHDGIWRAACLTTIPIPELHFEAPSIARGVTDVGVGSGALLGAWWLVAELL